jgi:hypothetical protein
VRAAISTQEVRAQKADLLIRFFITILAWALLDGFGWRWVFAIHEAVPNDHAELVPEHVLAVPDAAAIRIEHPLGEEAAFEESGERVDREAEVSGDLILVHERG